MARLPEQHQRVDLALPGWAPGLGNLLLGIGLGVTFTWFGLFKYLPGLSRAQDLAQGLATDTISVLTHGLIPLELAITILLQWRDAVVLGLIAGVALRAVLLLLLQQMVGTLTLPLVLPELAFVRIPDASTLEGQFMVKNLVLISAGPAFGATARGGALVDQDHSRRQLSSRPAPGEA